MRTKYLNLLTLLTMMATLTAFAMDGWQATLKKDLPLFGDRNWIAVVDSAYPLQTSPGIETVCAKTKALIVVKTVLDQITKARHVRPEVYIDAEQKYVAETNAPGMSAYRNGLAKILAGRPVHVMPHELIIKKLDAAGKMFKILIIKTPMTLPYSSVYFHLKCGYWSAASENDLRRVMNHAE